MNLMLAGIIIWLVRIFVLPKFLLRRALDLTDAFIFVGLSATCFAQEDVDGYIFGAIAMFIGITSALAYQRQGKEAQDGSPT